MKEKILNHIREVCDLKRLEKRCEVKYKKYNYLVISKLRFSVGLQNLKYACIKTKELPFEEFKRIEIIGLPVELNHLLWAISDKEATILRVPRDLKNTRIQRARKEDDVFSYYDLTKSVPENLDNPELCSLVAKLLDIKST